MSLSSETVKGFNDEDRRIVREAMSKVYGNLSREYDLESLIAKLCDEQGSTPFISLCDHIINKPLY